MDQRRVCLDFFLLAVGPEAVLRSRHWQCWNELSPFAILSCFRSLSVGAGRQGRNIVSKEFSLQPQISVQLGTSRARGRQKFHSFSSEPGLGTYFTLRLVMK